jgi:V/A-type H+-transporting ATPase subunit I
MIVKMRKITFIGLNGEKDRFINRLQEVGATHVTLPMEAVEPTEVARELQKVTEIRKFLSRFGQARGEVSDPSADYAEICSEREELGQEETRLLGEISALKKERAVLEPWGDFDPRDIALLRSKGMDVRFYARARGRWLL